MSNPANAVNTEVPSIARVYDAVLNGKDNFQVDREVVEGMLAAAPDQRTMAWNNRRWLSRVVGYLADVAGMDQFLDMGSGLPTVQNTHQVAQRWNRDAYVVYCDNDPAVNAYGRALLVENEQTAFATADLRKPREVLQAPEVRSKLDFDRPIVLMQCGTLVHVDDENDPWSTMREWVEALPSGSYVAITHGVNPMDGGPLEQQAFAVERAFHESDMGSGRWRTQGEVEALFEGLTLLEPGVVPVAEWWPSGPALGDPGVEQLLSGGVGYKP